MQRYERAMNSKDLLFSSFMASLRDAIFVNSEIDMENVKAMLARKGIDANQKSFSE